MREDLDPKKSLYMFSTRAHISSPSDFNHQPLAVDPVRLFHGGPPCPSGATFRALLLQPQRRSPPYAQCRSRLVVYNLKKSMSCRNADTSTLAEYSLREENTVLTTELDDMGWSRLPSPSFVIGMMESRSATPSPFVGMVGNHGGPVC
jgi:hypothetical protein